MPIRMVDHDPQWKVSFQEEAQLIHSALGALVVDIHHIGSTAIPGIFAKPIIDILLEVDRLSGLDEHVFAMNELGYEGLGEHGIPGRRYFRKDRANGVRTHQVHAFQAGDGEIARHLAFRDYLIAHPRAARDYSELKRRLAKKTPDDIEAYMQGKDPFIKEHEAMALAWRRALGGRV